jgi:hypothetical protein
MGQARLTSLALVCAFNFLWHILNSSLVKVHLRNCRVCRVKPRWSSPLTEARVKGPVRNRHLPGATDSLGAAKAKNLHQINRDVSCHLPPVCRTGD